MSVSSSVAKYLQTHIDINTGYPSSNSAIRYNMVPASGSVSVLPLRTVYGHRGKYFVNLPLATTAQATKDLNNLSNPQDQSWP